MESPKLEPRVSPNASRKIQFTNMFNTINCDDLDEEDIVSLKEAVKEIENKVKENNKPKTITIPGKVHATVKKHCKNLNLNIGDWCSDVLLKEIEENTCIKEDDRDRDEILEEDMKALEQKYIKESQRERFLIKVDRLLMSSRLHFAGYSQYDGKPIYEYSGSFDFEMSREKAALEEYGIEMKLVRKKEVSKMIKYNQDLDILFL